jgi:hypothetical protein
MMNNNSRLAETKRVPKINYRKMVKVGRNPNVKGNANRQFGPYNLPNKEGNCNNVAQNCGNITPRRRGQGRCSMGHGGHANTGKGKCGNRVPRAPVHILQRHKVPNTPMKHVLIMSYISLDYEKH